MNLMGIFKSVGIFDLNLRGEAFVLIAPLPVETVVVPRLIGPEYRLLIGSVRPVRRWSPAASTTSTYRSSRRPRRCSTDRSSRSSTATRLWRPSAARTPYVSATSSRRSRTSSSTWTCRSARRTPCPALANRSPS